MRWSHNKHRLTPNFVMIICWSSLCFGQLSGRFYLDREAYAPGEPVFLYFEVTNNGADAYNILAADPYSFVRDTEYTYPPILCPAPFANNSVRRGVALCHRCRSCRAKAEPSASCSITVTKSTAPAITKWTHDAD